MYQPNLPLGENGQRVTACADHIALSKNAAKEGMVLLKNNGGLLPIAQGTKLALFGIGTFDYVKGGGGSGDVTVEYEVNLYEGLKKLGSHVEICEELADFYRAYIREISDTFYWPGQKPEPALPDELCVRVREYTDTAVISISRFSGEGWDRDLKGHPMYEEGDFYLSHAERAMVEQVKKHFPKIVVVMNVGGMVDTEWFCSDDTISAVLMAWQGGMEGGTAAAELLCGYGNPSGKLSDTFAKKLEDYPSTENFHESDAYVDYTEDIYVGYRYFETIPGAAERVNYPFGFGLSYTTFDWSVQGLEQKDSQFTLKATVQNTGSYAGKEVIQVYVSAPQGKLGKAARSLVAFQKTELLEPGCSQELLLKWDLSAMVSYDDLGKVAKAAYILEKGDYFFYVGNSVRDTVKLDDVFSLTEDQIVQQLSTKIQPHGLKKRLLADGSYEALALSEVEKEIPDFMQPLTEDELQTIYPLTRSQILLPRGRDKRDIHWFDEVADGKITLDEFVEQLSNEDLCHLLGGQPNLGVANTQGFGNLPEFGVPNAMTADGPAGIRINSECGVCTTAFPCSTQVCCTWDPEIAYAVGEAGAKELKENNLAIWLTPAVNIHRSPLCGRNFEYYSEDPVLAGVMAGGMVRGIQSQKVSACVKHFALNNKETNRKNSDSRVSERAAREIYLKAFEIIVKTAEPWYIMSSYNLINGDRASECRELLEDILRGEWGYDGVVSTDWHTYSEHYKEVKAGNDIRMPGGFPKRLMLALEHGAITREELMISAKRVLNLLLRLE
jgi:beta-glucosidase